MTITDLKKKTIGDNVIEEPIEKNENDEILEHALNLEKEMEDSEAKLDEQIAVFEPVGRAVTRVIKHPNGTEKEFVQKEFTFMTKIRFLRLMSGTIRLAAEAGGTTVSEIITDTFGDVQDLTSRGISSESVEDIVASQFITTVINLVELAPDFLEELFLIALEVPRKEDEVNWALEAFETIDDDTGFDILDTIVAQNSKAIKDFFTERLVKTARRGQYELNINQNNQDTKATE